MRYYLLRETITDGENNYEENGLLKSTKLIKNDIKAFEKYLEENWSGAEVRKIEKNWYEIGDDYRGHKLDYIEEITENEFEVLKKFHIGLVIES